MIRRGDNINAINQTQVRPGRSIGGIQYIGLHKRAASLALHSPYLSTRFQMNSFQM